MIEVGAFNSESKHSNKKTTLPLKIMMAVEGNIERQPIQQSFNRVNIPRKR